MSDQDIKDRLQGLQEFLDNALQIILESGKTEIPIDQATGTIWLASQRCETLCGMMDKP